MQISTDFGVWASAICTLALYSMLYKENIVYRLFEHLFIGLGAGFGIGYLIAEVLLRYWWEPMMSGYWAWAFVLPAGLLLYLVHSPKYQWMSRIVFGFLIGVSSGLWFQIFASQYIPQLHDSFRPLHPKHAGGWAEAINNLVFILILLTVLSYFLFSIEQKSRVLKTSTLIGRWALMVFFGAIFGNTVMARMALLVVRLYDLFGNWLGVLK